MLALAIVCGLAGVLLLAFGLRGRRVDDHPLCAACGFDLLGTYPARSTCPECGAGLAGAGAVRVGRRRRRRAPVAAGVALLLVALGIGGAQVWGAAAGFNWNTVKPAWLLQMESGSEDAARAGAAVAELADRLRGGKLSGERTRALIARALDAQADTDATWVHEWTALLEAADEAGRLSAEDLARYLRQSIRASYASRERVRQGDRWPIALGLTLARISADRSVWMSAELQGVTVGGRELASDRFRGPAGMVGFSGGGGSGSIGAAIEIDVPPGRHEVVSRWMVRIINAPEDPTVLAELPVTVEGELEVTPASKPTVTLIDDPSLADEVRKRIRLERADLDLASGQPFASGDCTIQRGAIGLAFDIYWRVGEREWKLGSVAAAPGVTMGTSYGDFVEGFEGGPVTVILRSSAAAALRSLDVEEIWSGELEFPGVEVKTRGE